MCAGQFTVLASWRRAASPWIWTFVPTQLEAGDLDSEPEGVFTTGTSAGFLHPIGKVSATQSLSFLLTSTSYCEMMLPRGAGIPYGPETRMRSVEPCGNVVTSA